MKIHAVHINHLLSFNTLVWDDLDPHLNVIVGPNSVGKTNLFRALQGVRDALSSERDEAITRWIDTGHQGAAETFTITLDLQFTTEWERRLLCTFFAALLCNEHEIYQALQNNPNPQSLRRFSAWVQKHLRPENLSWLFTGRLTATLAGRLGWQCQYEAQPGKQGFRLDLSHGGTLFGLATPGNATANQNWGPLFVAWRNSLQGQERVQLDNELQAISSGMDFPVPDLSHLPDWVSAQHGIILRIDGQTRSVDPATLTTHRAFATAL